MNSRDDCLKLVDRFRVAKSIDGGATWPHTALTVVAEDNPPIPDLNNPVNDKGYITVDNTGGSYDGNLYISWTRKAWNGVLQALTNRIHFSRSTNGGATFSPPMELSLLGTPNNHHASVPAVGPNGEVYVAWTNASNNQTSAEFWVIRSTNGGQTFAFPPRLAAIGDPLNSVPGHTGAQHSFPTIAVDRSTRSTRGTVYLAWADQSGINGNGPDILLVSSADGGETWCAPTRVSDDTNGQYQWFPWMTVDANGVIDIVFNDRRDSDASFPPHYERFHLYRARSMDGGDTFLSNVPVTTQVSIPTLDPILNCCSPTFGVWIGDYNGLATGATLTHPFWADVRASEGECEGFTESIAIAPPPGCPGFTNVITSSMLGYNDSGPTPDDMTVHFVFDLTELADEFKIQYRRQNLDPPGPWTSWTEVSCSAISSSCGRCFKTYDVEIIQPCQWYRYEWQAKARNCQGWAPNWSSTQTFTTPNCLQEP